MTQLLEPLRLRILLFLRKLGAKARERRLAMFRRLAPIGSDWRVLDLGCGHADNAWLKGLPNVVGLDLRLSDVSLKPYARFILGNATSLPFRQGTFDLVFSNSMIEHLPTWEDQVRCAQEIRRVGHRYWVQVPNRHFPIDPHYIIPFFQYLPYPAMRWWSRHFALGWHGKNEYELERVNCLTQRQMQRLFPEATILKERFGPLTKSYIAIANNTTTSAS